MTEQVIDLFLSHFFLFPGTGVNVDNLPTRQRNIDQQQWIFFCKLFDTFQDVAENQKRV